MAKQAGFDYRTWRGEKDSVLAAYRKYEFPVTTRKAGEPVPGTAPTGDR